MKFFIWLNISICFVCCNISAQLFTPVQIDTSHLNIKKIVIGDLNKDDYDDIIVIRQLNPEQVSVFYNNGINQFSGPVDLYGGLSQLNDVSIADFNNDGWMDVFFFSNDFHNERLIWMPNQQGQFPQAIVIDSNFQFLIDIEPLDVENDGDMDIVLTCDGKLYIYVNDGLGNFQRISPATPLTEFYAMGIFDFNNDGFHDILLGSVGIIAMKNIQGNFVFDSLYSKLPISIPGLYFMVKSADFNNDGAMDALLFDASRRWLFWLVNNGIDRFIDTVIIDRNMLQVAYHTGDFNHDDYPDIVSVYPQRGTVELFINNENGRFQQSEILMTAQIPFIREVASGDFNNDGSPDIVVANPLTVFINTLPLPAGISGEQKSISAYPEIFPNPASKSLQVIVNQSEQVSIFDLNGILKGNFYFEGKGNYQIHIDNLPEGIYLLSFKNQGITLPFVISK